MSKRSRLLAALILGFGGRVGADPVRVGGVTVAGDVLRIQLSGPPPASWIRPALHDHGAFAQLDLTEVAVSDPGVFHSLDHPVVERVVFFSLGPDAAVMRLFSRPGAGPWVGRTQVEVLDDQVVLTLPASVPAPPVSVPAPSTEAAAPAAGAELSTVALLAGRVDPPLPMAEDPLGRLKLAGLVSCLVFACGLALLTGRRVWLAQSRGSHPVPTLGLHLVEQLVLGPKMKLCLVEAAGGRYLFSVSGDQLVLLDRIEAIVAAPRLGPGSSSAAPVRPPGGEIELRRAAGASAAGELRTRPASPPPASGAGGIRVEIGDDGVVAAPRRAKKTQASEDIAKLIREKLSALPKV